MDNDFVKDLEIQDEREYIIVQLQLDIKKINLNGNRTGWVDVSTSEFKHVFNLAKDIVTKCLSNSNNEESNLKLLGTYQMIICGTEKDYWTKSQIDIHKFKINSDGIERSLRLKDVETEDNLTIFNKIFFGNKRIRGDRLENLKLPTTIYGLGNHVTDEFQQLSKTFLLNISLDRNPDSQEVIALQNKQYNLTSNTIISNFGTLLVYIAKLIDLYRYEYTTINNQSNEIREKALALQIKINNLLTMKSKEQKTDNKGQQNNKIETEVDLQYTGMEEKLLLKASHYFSMLTEINQILARVNYFRNEAALNIDKTTQALGFIPITLLSEADKEIASVSLEFKQFSEKINFNFQNLKIELDHSQSTIRNTVDILKTFLESEQRIVSQKSSEAINWIVIVFAGLGLADALGNFVIFWLQGGSGYLAILWFSIIMIMLITTIVILYFWYFKRPKYLKLLGKF